MPRTKVYQENAGSGDQNWAVVAKKGIYATAIASVGAYVLFGESGESQFFSVPVPAPVAAGLGAGAGSVVSDLFSGFIIDKLDQGSSIKTAESTAVKLAVSGVGTALALNYGSGAPISANTIMLGSGAKFAGDAVYYEMDPLAMLF